MLMLIFIFSALMLLHTSWQDPSRANEKKAKTIEGLRVVIGYVGKQRFGKTTNLLFPHVLLLDTVQEK